MWSVGVSTNDIHYPWVWPIVRCKESRCPYLLSMWRSPISKLLSLAFFDAAGNIAHASGNIFLLTSRNV